MNGAALTTTAVRLEEVVADDSAAMLEGVVPGPRQPCTHWLNLASSGPWFGCAHSG